MTRKVSSRLAGVLPLQKEDKGPSRYTRLSAESDRFIQSQINQSGGELKESTVIAELVDYAVKVRGLEAAAENPAVRELLRTIDDLMSLRVGESEDRMLQHLRVELFSVRRLLATVLMTNHCSMKLLEVYLSSRKPDQIRSLESFYAGPPLGLDSLDPEGRNQTLLDALFMQWEEDAKRVITMLDEERASRLSALSGDQSQSVTGLGVPATNTPTDTANDDEPL
jgi:hypothetical protein